MNPGPAFILMTMLTLTTGSVFIMWLGEQITERGVGNGMSLLIFAGIVVGLPRAVVDLFEKARYCSLGKLYGSGADACWSASWSWWWRSLSLWSAAERRIPVQYAKRVVGRKDDGRAVHASAVAGEFRRRDAGDFRVIDSEHSAELTLSNAFKPGAT